MAERVPLPELVASRLEAEADSIVERWIDWIQSRVGTRTISALPRLALRNHIPPVVRSLAEYIRSPLSATRESMFGHLELHGRIRRDQGYEIHELLAEFDGLAHIVTGFIREVVAEQEDCEAQELLETMERFSTGIRSIGFVTVGAYRELEAQQKTRLAEAMRDFARAVSHELRTPLNSLSLGLRLLVSDGVARDERRRNEQVSSMQRAVGRASGMLDDIQLLAFAEGARGGPRHRSLVRVVQDVVEELSVIANQRGVQVSIVGELPEVDVDKLTGEVVLVNLLGNAIKYSDRDKAERRVSISAEHQCDESKGDTVTVRVEDNGIGIPADLVPHVFQRNFRAHPDLAEGTGLGLALCKALVDERGGHIWVESEAGRGTTFAFRISALDAVEGSSPADSPRKLMQRSIEEALAAEGAFRCEDQPPPGP